MSRRSVAGGLPCACVVAFVWAVAGKAQSQSCDLSEACSSGGHCTEQDERCISSKATSLAASDLASSDPESESEREADSEGEYSSPELLGTGIALVVGGLTVAGIGMGLFFANFCPGGGCTRGQEATVAGVVMMPVGTVMAIVGIPLTVIGALPAEPEPVPSAGSIEPIVGPTSLGLRGTF